MMDGKTVVITGANSGIGKETARGLLRQGAHVVMVCRDQGKGEGAREELLLDNRTDPSCIDLTIADLSSQSSIRNLAEGLRNQYEKIDVLINNAGLIMGKRTLTEDGIEWTFAVNHLAPFLLTNLLIEPLMRAPSGRIVTVSSGAHHMGSMDLENIQSRKGPLSHGNLQSQRGYHGFRVYSNSKLANVLFTFELSRKLQVTTITANCLHPGVVRTNFGRSGSFLFHTLFTLVYPFMISPKRGAVTSIYLASSTEVEGVTGKYFKRRKVARSSRTTHHLYVARKLWEVSAELTGLRKEERLENMIGE